MNQRSGQIAQYPDKEALGDKVPEAITELFPKDKVNVN